MSRQMSIGACKRAYEGRHGVTKFRNIVYKGVSHFVCCSDCPGKETPYGVNIEFIINRRTCRDVLSQHHRKGRAAVNLDDAAAKAAELLEQMGTDGYR